MTLDQDRSDQDRSATFVCPSCGASNPSTHGFIDWCEVCDWNVDPDGLAAAQGAAQPAPAKPISFVERFVIGLIVHGSILATIGLGLAILVFSWFSIVGLIFGFGLVLLGGLLLPHGAALPAGTIRLGEGQNPELHEYVAKIADQQGVSAPAIVGFTESFQNWSGATGALIRPTVVFSYPIWQSLNPDELAAFVAAELEVLDSRRSSVGIITDAAIKSLSTIVSGSKWERPDGAERVKAASVHASSSSAFGGAQSSGSTEEKNGSLVARARPERIVFGTAGFLLNRLATGTEAANQSAVIDAYANVASVRGPAIVARVLDTELMTKSLNNAAVRARRHDGSLLEAIRDYAARLPDHERERRRRDAKLSGIGALGPWPSVAARSLALAGDEPDLAPPPVPIIRSETLRGTIEVRLYDQLKPI